MKLSVYVDNDELKTSKLQALDLLELCRMLNTSSQESGI